MKAEDEPFPRKRCVMENVLTTRFVLSRHSLEEKVITSWVARELKGRKTGKGEVIT